MAERPKSHSDDRVSPAPGGNDVESAVASKYSIQASALPETILVRVLAGSRRIGEITGPAVPLWLMAEPVELALDFLEAHGKTCRHPLQCTHVPGPLRPLLKMRRAARAQHRDKVHMALWRYEHSPIVELVRSEVIARHEQLADDLKSGAFFGASAFERALDGLDASCAKTLAAVLWAQGLDDARSAGASLACCRHLCPPPRTSRYCRCPRTRQHLVASPPRSDASATNGLRSSVRSASSQVNSLERRPIGSRGRSSWRPRGAN